MKKVVMISSSSNSNLYALTDDGEIWMINAFDNNNNKKWMKLPEIPESQNEECGETIESLNLTTRTFNALKFENLTKIDDLIGCSADRLLRIPNFGKSSLKELEDKLSDIGLFLSSSRL